MNRSFAAALLIGLAGCAGPVGLSPSASPTATVQSAGSVAEPSLMQTLPLPSGMVLPPILDPDGAGPPYARDEAVEVDGLIVVYRGTLQADGRYVARFDVTGSLQSPPGAMFFLPSGPSVGLDISGGAVTSEPFRLSSAADPSTLFAWRIGSETLVWELGTVDSD